MSQQYYIEHLLNEKEKKEFNAITGNKFPYKDTRGTDDLLYYYAPHTKEIVKKLVNYFDNKNIDLYEHAIEYFSKNTTKEQKHNLLDFFAMGIKEGRIDPYNQTHFKFLENLFFIPFNSQSKSFFESKLFILQTVINIDNKHLDKLGLLLMQYNKNHSFDKTLNEELKEYINYGVPANLIEQYPELVNFYKKLQECVQYKKSKQYLYTLEIDSNAIANTNNVITKDIQSNLFIALHAIIENFKNGNLIVLEKEDFQIVKSNVITIGSNSLEMQIFLKNEKSYELVDNLIEKMLPELINAIVNNTPYSKNDVPKLMGKILLEDKIDNMPIKNVSTTKKKI